MQVRKYSPTRFFPLNTPVAVLVSKLPVPRIDLGSVWRGDGRTSPPDDMSPPSARTRVSKGAKLKAVRRYASPQPAGTESRVAGRSNARELQVNGHGGGGLHKQPPPRSRRSVSHPDVRTIFSLPRDPRVREETGEGHCFVAGESATWCDVCCGYIVHDCRVCSGEDGDGVMLVCPGEDGDGVM
ncbi:hypothetical protein NHX12_020244 [Muraenolepis orangiensis]|uniref:Uncharacterized protein n=1 Tax=Muraenolepis orangiensis TaxID=630683 RepID=A0A9Q0IVM1_9TELE|nr:hypothetical protein NHX12_020244 [Muraenolepis orangiensis]